MQLEAGKRNGLLFPSMRRATGFTRSCRREGTVTRRASPLKLAAVAETSRRIAETKGRRDKIGLLANFSADTPPDEIEIAAAYLSGAVRQEKLGLGWATIQSAMPGTAAESASVEVAEVNAVLDQISRASGKGSAEAKQRLLRDLLSRLTAEEQRFLGGLIVGELRQGALEGLVVEAIARAANRPAAEVRRAFMMAGDLPAVARAALADGETGLSAFAVQLFQPVLPMLAGSAEDVDEALAELGEAALEYKLDGARVQIHKSGDEVRVYSRRLNEVTGAVPELVEAARGLSAREIIVEGEAIALRPDGTPLPFQTTMRRFGRKLDVERVRDELPVTLFLFDILYLDGASLLDEPLSRRAALLAGSVPASLLVPRIVTSSVAGGGRLPPRRDGARPRGRDGEGARRALRGRPPGPPLAQGEDGADARPGGARGRVGPRPAARVAQQPASRRPRSGGRRIRHARQDVQGDDRRDAALADRAPAASWR